MNPKPHQASSNTLISKNSAPISSRYDDRQGLGYGQLAQKFHKPWKYTDTFPFSAPDEAEDIVLDAGDEETKSAISTKVHDFLKTDPLAFKGANRMYFVGASTNLAACFERPDDVLREISGVSKGIVAIPGLYGRSDGPAVGGFSASKAFDERPFKRTGTTQGWAGNPPQSKVAAEDEYIEEVQEDEPNDEFYSLSDLSKYQKPSLGECLGLYDHT